MTHISFSSLFQKINMGGKTDWVGKKLTSQIFPRGKKLTGEKTDRYTGFNALFQKYFASKGYPFKNILVRKKSTASADIRGYACHLFP